MRLLKTDLQIEAAANLRQIEAEQGFDVIDDAKWLNKSEWREIVVSQDSRRIRLVLLDALHPGKGAFTRLIMAIGERGLVPVIVEPNQLLIDWCHRHDYRPRTIGKRQFRHEVWYPRRSAY